MCGNGSLMRAALYDKLPFDPVKDFAPISQISSRAISSSCIRTCRRKPSPKWSHSPRPNRRTHLRQCRRRDLAASRAELFKSMAKIDIRPIAYRGTTALVPDLLAAASRWICQYREHAAAGEGRKAAPFAVTSRKRSALCRPADHRGVSYPDTRRCRGSA